RGRRRRRGHQDRQTLPHRRLVGTRPRPVRRPPHRRTHRTRRVRRLRGRGPRGGPAGGRRRPGGRGRQEGPVTIPDRQEHRPHRHAARRHPRSGGPRQRTGRHRDRHQPRPGPQQEGGRRVTPDDLFGYLIPSVVVGPLLAAALCLVVSRRPRVQNVITIVTLTGILVVSGVLLRLTDVHGMHTVQVGGWDAPVGSTLVADRLSAMMLVVASIVLLSVIIDAVGQGVRDGSGDQPTSIFLPTYLALAAGLAAAFIAGDLFNLFVGFEILLAASYVLLTLGASQERVRAGVSYTVVSMVSSMVFLLGIGLTYAAAGTLNLSQLAVRLSEVPDGLRNTIFAVFLVAFGIKAAVFPLSNWLPDSYPTAPAPVTAVFAGLLTKVGVYAIIRFHTLVFPDGAMDDVLLIAGLLTMVVGILGAIAQTDI